MKLAWLKEPLINSNKTVIASVARQSHTMASVSWRLPRYARNDELIRGSLIFKSHPQPIHE